MDTQLIQTFLVLVEYLLISLW